MASRAESTKDAILDGAIDLFISEGFEATSMDAIALRAEVAKGTLYYHFNSKEGIVDAIMERFAEAAEERLAAIASESGIDPIKRLARLTAALKELNASSFPRLHRLKYIDIHLRTQRVMVERLAPYFARVLEDGAEKGLWKASRPRELAAILFAANAYLLDPEFSEGRQGDLVAAEVEMMARVLGIDAKKFAPAFASLK
jgi:AcrR family transcriptional regulator